MNLHHNLWQSRPEDAIRARGLGTDKLAGQRRWGERAQLCIEKWLGTMGNVGDIESNPGLYPTSTTTQLSNLGGYLTSQPYFLPNYLGIPTQTLCGVCFLMLPWENLRHVKDSYRSAPWPSCSLTAD